MPKSSETLRHRPKINKTDIAYAAAMVDGEGWISASHLTGNGGDPALHIGICNSDRRLMVWLSKRFGGRVRERKWKSNRLTKKPHYEWAPRTWEIVWFLKMIIPHMVLKQRQARLAVIFRSLVGRRSEVAKKRRIVDKIHEANRAR